MQTRRVTALRSADHEFVGTSASDLLLRVCLAHCLLTGLSATSSSLREVEEDVLLVKAEPTSEVAAVHGIPPSCMWRHTPELWA